MSGSEFIPIDDHMFDNQPLPGLTGWIKVDTGLGDTISKRVPTMVTTGKNLGKISATNVFTQALRDAYSLYNKQMKKANTVVDILYPPMLAQVYKDQKTPPTISESTPVYVQPKFNGVRCVTTLDNSTVIMYSRRKNIYPGFSYIKDEVKPILKKYHDAGRKLYLDGELYKHGTALQDISGYARREDKDDDIKLNYMVYDCFIVGEPLLFSARKAILDEIFQSGVFQYTREVETHKVTDVAMLDIIYKQALADGYEGIMIRKNAPYAHSYNESHSKVLLKMKPTYDAELEIADYTVGKKGKASGALMIICRVGNITFPVTPALELPERIALTTKMAVIEPNGKTHFANHWLGKKIIVEYDELSKDNIPQRARTKLQIRTWD